MLRYKLFTSIKQPGKAQLAESCLDCVEKRLPDNQRLPVALPTAPGRECTPGKFRQVGPFVLASNPGNGMGSLISTIIIAESVQLTIVEILNVHGKGFKLIM